MTDRLSPTDVAFLYSEDATTPMHVGGVVVLNPPGAFDFQRILQLVSSRLSLVPRYRQKVRFVPGRLARPVWVDDDGFDITYHVRRSALPPPGTREQLDDLVGRLISRPLDRSRPLWELYIVEGLEGGRVALVNKTHETMVDRVGAVDVAAAILDVTRSARELPTSPWIPAPAPSEADLVVDAVSDLAARPTEVLDSIRLAGLDLRSTVAGLLDAGLLVADVLLRSMSRKPPSPLTVRAAAPRRFATATAHLATVKAIRAAHGGSVNDVILTVIAGALRVVVAVPGRPRLHRDRASSTRAGVGAGRHSGRSRPGVLLRGGTAGIRGQPGDAAASGVLRDDRRDRIRAAHRCGNPARPRPACPGQPARDGRQGRRPAVQAQL